MRGEQYERRLYPLGTTTTIGRRSCLPVRMRVGAKALVASASWVHRATVRTEGVIVAAAPRGFDPVFGGKPVGIEVTALRRER